MDEHGIPPQPVIKDFSNDFNMVPPISLGLIPGLILSAMDPLAVPVGKEMFVYSMIEAIMTTELEEKLRAKGQTENIHTLTDNIGQSLQDYTHEFIELGPDETFKENIKLKVTELFPNYKD